MDQKQTSTRNPWLFVPSLYFMQGLPYMMATYLSGAMYKKLGVGNEVIALWTSLLIWAWTLKMLWGPLVDTNFTKRGWVVATQGLLLVAFVVLGFSMTLPGFFGLSVGVLFVIAFLSATHDIACDGYYLLALNKEQQAFFVGIRSTAFRGAILFVQAGLIWFAGELESRNFGPQDLWARTIWGAAAVYGVLWLYGIFAMPRPAEDSSGGVQRVEGDSVPFVEAMVTFFQQPRIAAVLAFILLYRLSESMVFTLAKLFLLDAPDKGGLGLTLKELSFINGTVGVVSLIVGGILGGILIAKKGLRKCLWPMVLCMHMPILLYVWAGFHQPQTHHVYYPFTSLGIPWKVTGELAISAVVAVDNLGYGFGLAAYLVYLMVVSQRGRYKTSHYAIATGIMALGAMGAGIASGYIQKAVGYDWFFVVAFLLALPGTLTLFFIPHYDDGDSAGATADAASPPGAASGGDGSGSPD